MKTSLIRKFKNTIDMKTRRLFTLFSLAILSTFSLFAQPAWYGGTPIVTPNVYNEVFQYGLNEVGTVYALLINYNYTTPVPTSL